ncbi:MAG TPA: hypothetical protein VJ845_03725 [Haploplasma sp.]|nr:hypothetical protein [Haploplasma sp.]
MKRFSLLILTLLLTITLFACGKSNFHAKIKLTGLSGVDKTGIGYNEINFDMELIDPDEQVKTQSINIILKRNEDNKKIHESTTSKNVLENNTKVQIEGLEEEVAYTLTITTTYNDKVLNLIEPLNITTTENMSKDIYTVEDFLEIKNNLYANYTLKNDLDFKGRDEEVKANLISNFRGNFDGGDFAIKNYNVVSKNSSLGLFGQLSSEATVKNLTIDGLSITKEESLDSTSGVSSYIGILFGQNSSSNVKVENITIKNSSLNLTINSTSNYLKFGLLGGTASGTFKDINVENTNKMNLTLKRHTVVYIGGLVGDPNKSAEFSNIVNGGDINLSIDQYNLSKPEKDENGKDIEGSEKAVVSTGGLVGHNVEVIIGGFLARNSETKVKNVITSTNINVKKVHYSVQTNGDEDKFDNTAITRNIEFYIGGLYGKYNDIYSTNMVYSGNIDVSTEFEFSNLLTKVDKDTETIVKIRHRYYYNLYVGGLAGITTKKDTGINNLVRNGGSIKVNKFTVDKGTPLKYTKTGDEVETALEQSLNTLAYGHLFGYDGEIKYSDLNNFGITTPLQDYLGDDLYVQKAIIEGENFKVITDLKEFFKDNEWMQENLK